MRAFGHLSGSVQQHRTTASELFVLLEKKLKKFSQEKDKSRKVIKACQILIAWGRFQQAFDESWPDMYPGSRESVEHEELFRRVAEVHRFLTRLALNWD